MEVRLVRTRRFGARFQLKNDHCTKTGSGQHAYRESSKTRTVFRCSEKIRTYTLFGGVGTELTVLDCLLACFEHLVGAEIGLGQHGLLRCGKRPIHPKFPDRASQSILSPEPVLLNSHRVNDFESSGKYTGAVFPAAAAGCSRAIGVMSSTTIEPA